jgi:hypothetical protein
MDLTFHIHREISPSKNIFKISDIAQFKLATYKCDEIMGGTAKFIAKTDDFHIMRWFPKYYNRIAYYAAKYDNFAMMPHH